MVILDAFTFVFDIAVGSIRMESSEKWTAFLNYRRQFEKICGRCFWTVISAGSVPYRNVSRM